MTEIPQQNPFNEADEETIAALKALIGSSRHGALATLEPETGYPVATRVGLAVDEDGNPFIFVSGLSAHTPALQADPRCSLLVGEVGRGDPLAHRRATLFCRAREAGRKDKAFAALLERFVEGQPKARLYAGLPDFRFFVLTIERATYNGGFGKAYRINGSQLAGR